MSPCVELTWIKNTSVLDILCLNSVVDNVVRSNLIMGQGYSYDTREQGGYWRHHVNIQQVGKQYKNTYRFYVVFISKLLNLAASRLS